VQVFEAKGDARESHGVAGGAKRYQEANAFHGLRDS
jgi:hypothetical protein